MMDAGRNKTLQAPLQFIKGVGPDRAKLFERLDLHSAQDVLFFFPRDYVDLSERRQLSELEEGTAASIVAEVEDFELREVGSGRTVLGVVFRQDDLRCRGVWFNQPFMANRFRRGDQVVVSGAPKRRGISWEFVHPRVTRVDDAQTTVGEILPVYSLTEKLKQHQIRKVVANVIADYVELVPEVFPQKLLTQRSLLPIVETLKQVHCPTSQVELERARFRLVYQELLVMQLALAMRQAQLTSRQSAIPMKNSSRIDARIRRLFPFELTDDQNQAIQQISADLAESMPMNRLLQGDVGTGKTAVAAYAMLLTVAHKAQAVLMAPTEVLARQHCATLQRLLEKSSVRIGYLSGSSTAKQKRVVLDQVAAGQIDLLVGTQAVIQQTVEFHQLGLVIIDEQHKFGVIQRASLRQGKNDPHYLVMTATPIPRTIAMTMFGDLDVSVIRSSPPGRQPVHTYLGEESRREQWWDFFRRKLREGQQGFVISPVVNVDDDETTSAEAALENLANGELAEFRIDLLHGKMKSAEKLEAMRIFEAGETQVLVATSVVEVGIDVPNANLMTIEHGERFGLSQLHQLRGRVGRGAYPGYVCVFASTDSDDSRERLEAFAATRDGFELAEVDFRLRGPGELFGTRQHGLPPLMVADLRRDENILQLARSDAQQIIEDDPGMAAEQWHRLRKMVLKRYGKRMSLGDVA